MQILKQPVRIPLLVLCLQRQRFHQGQLFWPCDYLMGLMIIDGFKACWKIIGFRAFSFGPRAMLGESIIQSFCLKSALGKSSQLTDCHAFILLLINFGFWMQPLLVFQAESAVNEMSNSKRLPLFCLVFDGLLQEFEMMADTFVGEEVFCMRVIERVVGGTFLCKFVSSVKSLFSHFDAALGFDMLISFVLLSDDGNFHQFIMRFIACLLPMIIVIVICCNIVNCTITNLFSFISNTNINLKTLYESFKSVRFGLTGTS